VDRTWIAAWCVGWLALATACGAVTFDQATPESDARILGMAGAGTATAAGASAVWWNPAGLADTPRADLLLSHVGLHPGLEQQSAVVAVRPVAASAWVLAVQTDIFRTPGIPVDEAFTGLSAVPPQGGYRVALHLAGDVGHGLALGAACGRMRGLAGSVEPGPVMVADCGVRWQHRGSRVAVAMRGARLASTSLAPVVSVAASQQLAAAAWLGAAQLDRDALGDLHPSGALEWRALPALALRAGARYEDTEHGTAATAGFGLLHERIHLDYAVRMLRGEPAVHALTFGVAFGDLPGAPPAKPAASGRVEDGAPPVGDAASRPDVEKSPAKQELQQPRAKSEPPRTAPEGPPAEHAPPATPRHAPDVRAPRPAAPVTARFTVYAGPYTALEKAGAAIVALTRIGMQPVMQSQDGQFFVVCDRGLLRADAEALKKRAARAGVDCKLSPE